MAYPNPREGYYGGGGSGGTGTTSPASCPGDWWKSYVAPGVYPPCPGQPPTAAVQAAFRAAPTELLEQFRQYLLGANNGVGPTLAELRAGCYTWQVARAAMGGRDCIASTRSGQLAQAAFVEVMRYAGAPPTGDPTGPSLPGDPVLPPASSPLVWGGVALLALLVLRGL